ncbi:MAG: hypothetical protein JG768_1417 [Fusobacteriales bacterium]|nr:hypothetical protein [Fusobacteriales bacterium]
MKRMCLNPYFYWISILSHKAFFFFTLFSPMSQSLFLLDIYSFKEKR